MRLHDGDVAATLRASRLLIVDTSARLFGNHWNAHRIRNFAYAWPNAARIAVAFGLRRLLQEVQMDRQRVSPDHLYSKQRGCQIR